jgi:hypothetical protein
LNKLSRDRPLSRSAEKFAYLEICLYPSLLSRRPDETRSDLELPDTMVHDIVQAVLQLITRLALAPPDRRESKRV